jgi:adenylyltransferase/sulfurtransferase
VRDYSRLDSTAFSRRQTAITALVVGAGALGNEVIKNLALVGVRDLWILDRDVVEASNLTRSILFCTHDIDTHIEARTPKATFAGLRVSEINPDVAVRTFVGEIADFGYGVLRRADIVFSCVDNELARLELGWACARLRKPLVDGGLGLINHSSAQVTLFPPEAGPCYACRKGAERRRQLLQESQGREDPCWRKEDEIRNAAGVPTTPIMASVAGAFQVELGLRAIGAKDEKHVGTAHLITMHPSPGLRTVTFERSPACPLHDQASTISTVVEYPQAHSEFWTPADLLKDTPSDTIVVFDWPITTKAVCRSCSHRWQPMMRRAAFRRQICPSCEGHDLIEMDVLTGMDITSPLAQMSLADLGMPRAHIFEIVSASDPLAARLHAEITGDLVELCGAAVC